MLVKNWMSKKIITIDADDSMADASRIMKEHQFRGLPVMQDGKLVGIVTDRDLKRASASDATTLDIHELLYLISKIKVRDIMTKDPITISVDDTVDEAAEVLLANKVSRAPVVDHDGSLVGMITQSDIFRVLVSLSGVREKGIQLGFLLEDRPGSIKEVVDILRGYGCRVGSILSSMPSAGGPRHVYIKVFDCERGRMEEMKTALKAKADLLYLIDRREKTKEVYKDYVRPSGAWIPG